MGCGFSTLSENAEIYKKVPELRGWMKEFKALALSEQAVNKFWKIFKKIDMDGSGSIEIVEMLVHFDIDRTKFTRRVFGIFDEDNSGYVDLREFILALWNYCTLTKATLVIFAFDLYDKDGSGIIDTDEIRLMLKEVYGNKFETNAYAKRIMETLQGFEVQAVDIDTFRKFVKKHPALLFPAFEMQRKMQRHALGQAYWRRLGEKRLRLSSGQFIPIKKFMEMHLESMIVDDKKKKKMNDDAILNPNPLANSGERKGSLTADEGSGSGLRKKSLTAQEGTGTQNDSHNAGDTRNRRPSLGLNKQLSNSVMKQAKQAQQEDPKNQVSEERKSSLEIAVDSGSNIVDRSNGKDKKEKLPPSYREFNKQGSSSAIRRFTAAELSHIEELTPNLATTTSTSEAAEPAANKGRRHSSPSVPAMKKELSARGRSPSPDVYDFMLKAARENNPEKGKHGRMKDMKTAAKYAVANKQAVGPEQAVA